MRELTDRDNSTAKSNSSGFSKIWVLILLVVVIAIGALVFFNHKNNTDNKSNKNTSVSSTNSTSKPPASTPSVVSGVVNAAAPSVPYNESADGFNIDFSIPGAPTISHATYDSPSGGAIPESIYRQGFSVSTENAYFTVYVYHYPATYTFASDYLSEALTSYLDVINESYQGSKITTQQSTQFESGPAITATILVPLEINNEKVNTYDYVLITTKNENAYEISTYGLSQSNYNTFVNSFKYIS